MSKKVQANRSKNLNPKQAYNKPLETILAQIAKMNSNKFTLLGTYSFFDNTPALSKTVLNGAKFYSTDVLDRPFDTLESAIDNEREFSEMYLDDFVNNNVYPRFKSPVSKSLFNDKLEVLKSDILKYELRKFIAKDNAPQIYAVYSLNFEPVIDLCLEVCESE